MSNAEAGQEQPDRRWATVVIMTIATVAVTIGDLIMSHAMRTLGPLRLRVLEEFASGELREGWASSIGRLAGEIYQLAWLIFGDPIVWLAIACMFTFLVLWMVALSWSDLSFVMPLTALTYILNAILVGPVLGEHVSATRWMGTLMIAVGVGMVTMEKQTKDEV